ncbi:MAG: hypothetical protein HY824_10020 [Acidobacteria bacterium]|nr:hypothetical protein [Acidobacteriota bacterium]
MTKRFYLTLTLLLAAGPAVLAQTAGSAPPPPPAAAPTEPDYPIVRVGMVTFLQYGAELKNRSGQNAFDVTRAYLNINGQLARNVRFRFTPDIRRITDGSLAGSLTVRVKYAFAQFDNILNERSWVRFGLHQSPWLDFEESINRYRVQGQVFSEREGLIPGSADFGASYFTPLPGGYGELHAGVYNGEGFAQTDPNKYKSVQTRLTIRPFPNRGIARGLRVSGFASAGWYAADRPRHLGILMGSFEHARLAATVQRLAARESPPPAAPRDIDRSGWSVFVEPRQGPAGLAGILRIDRFDPDDGLVNNAQRRVIAGGAYWFVWPRTRLGLVATDEQVRYDAPARPDEHRLLFQTHIEF